MSVEWSKGLVCGGALMLGRRGFFGLLLGAGAGAVVGKAGVFKAVAPVVESVPVKASIATWPGRYCRIYCTTTSGATVTATATLQWSEDGETWEMRDNVTC